MTRLFVPGRIEVLGKHTDYAGGRSLLAAVDRGFTITARPADGQQVVVEDTGLGESVTVAIPPDRCPPETAGPDWAVYVRTVVRRVVRDFPGRVRGCEIRLSSDLPPAAGLSSSSALITGLYLAMDAVCGLSGSDRYRAAIPDRLALAGYLGALERGSIFPPLASPARNAGVDAATVEADAGVGTRGGSEDHVAMLCGEPGALVQYRFEPVRKERSVPVPTDYVFAVAASGVRAEKTGSARERYNRLSDEAARVVALWQEGTGQTEPHLGAILDATDRVRLLEVIRKLAPGDRDRLERRIRHFATESQEIVPTAGDALAAGDLARFGEAVDRSQAAAEQLLGNQVPETVHLARSARRLGAAAASAFGAGFGGSVWALVPTPVDSFLYAWRADYALAFPDRAAHARFFTTPPAKPARSI